MLKYKIQCVCLFSSGPFVLLLIIIKYYKIRSIPYTKMSFRDCVNDFCIKELLLHFKCADLIAVHHNRSDSLCQHFMALR